MMFLAIRKTLVSFLIEQIHNRKYHMVICTGRVSFACKKLRKDIQVHYKLTQIIYIVMLVQLSDSVQANLMITC